MENFTIRDLRERTGDLVRACEDGQLSVVSKRGRPLCVTVPIDETLIKLGVATALAVQLYKSHTVSLGIAAKVASMRLEEFMEQLGALGIAVIDFAPTDLAQELEALG